MSWIADKLGWFAFWNLGGRERERSLRGIRAGLRERDRQRLIAFLKLVWGEKYWTNPELTQEKSEAVYRWFTLHDASTLHAIKSSQIDDSSRLDTDL